MTVNTGARWFEQAAFPALLLILGMPFCLALSYFLGQSWTPLATKVFYGGLLLWGGGIIWCRRPRSARDLLSSDWLMLLLVLVTVASLLQHDALLRTAGLKYMQMMPFMVVLPYLLGRVLTREEWGIFASGLLWSAPLLLCFAALNFWMSPETVLSYRRWIFFGYDHTPLLLGFVLAGAVLVSISRILDRSEPAGTSMRRATSPAWWGMLGVCLLGLVMVSARGSLLGLVVAVTVMLAFWGGALLRKRLLVLVYVLMVILLGMALLPKAQGQLYAQLGGVVSPSAAPVATFPRPNTGTSSPGLPNVDGLRPGPVFGQASCTPFVEGVNSVAMRILIYREALALFQQSPWTGVGAAMFGEYSCTGGGGFPHSTLLQLMSELGMAGLLVFLSLLVVTFRGLNCRDRACGGRAGLTLAFLAFYTCTDQIYGNYFMAVGTYFFIGQATALRAEYSKANG